MMKPRPFLARRVALARLALLWERLWLALWPGLTVGGILLALLLSDLLPLLPGWLHALLLAGGGVGLGVSLWAGFRTFRWPTEAEARHRLEQATPHRPLTAARDHLAGGEADPLARILWQAHLDRMRKAAANLPGLWPSPQVARRDPWGLRVVPLLALVVVGAAAWHDPAARLVRGLTPTLGGVGSGDVMVEAWITPPDYTGQTLIYRRNEAGSGIGDLSVPEGSRLLVLIQGASFPGVSVGAQDVTPEMSPGGTQRAEAMLEATDGPAVIEVRDHGFTVVSWPVTVTPDRPPEIAFSRAPEAGQGGHLIVPVTASDDIGLASVRLLFGLPYRTSESVDLPLPTGRPARMSGDVRVDLTAHRWAGLRVHLHLVAMDGKGQESITPLVDMDLPERVFKHPVAQALIQARKRLVVGLPGQRRGVTAELDSLAVRPADFRDDPVVFLGLRMASLRLRYDRREAGVSEVVSLLWDLALRVEDGGLSHAEDALTAAREDLRQAMEDKAPPEVIREKLEAMREALRAYMQELARTMPSMEGLDLSALANQSVDMQSLDDLLKQMGDLTELGARQAAEAMLGQLEQMLEKLRGGQALSREALDNMAETARRLDDIAKRQEALLNQTFEEGRNDTARGQGATPPSSPPRPDTAAEARGAQIAVEQEALRQDLGQMMGDLGETLGAVPDRLGTAEFAMRRASEALAGQSWAAASSAQGEALAALREGAREAARQMMQAMGQGMVFMPGLGPSGGGDRDPMGRATGGVETNGVKVPDKPEQTRARALIQELRRRSNQPERLQDERDYLRRLLENF